MFYLSGTNHFVGQAGVDRLRRSVERRDDGQHKAGRTISAI
jgi:hypothetical protein